MLTSLGKRLLVAQRRPAVALLRSVHKGTDSTPPMRFISIPQRVAFYFFIAGTFLSYPTYVMLNLDNLRPRGDNDLGEEALAQRDERIAARA